MKVKIDPTLPALSEEQLEELKEVPEISPEEFKEQMRGIEQIIVSEQAKQQLEELGMSVDELVAVMLSEAEKLQ